MWMLWTTSPPPPLCSSQPLQRCSNNKSLCICAVTADQWQTDAPDFMKAGMSNVLLLWLHRRKRVGGKRSSRVRRGDSRRQILISPHRSVKGQQEACNRIHYVLLPCFIRSMWLECWCNSLRVGSINLAIKSVQSDDNFPVMQSWQKIFLSI